MIVLSLEEFAAKRTGAQRELEKELRPFVERALDRGVNTSGFRELLAEVTRIWREVYAEEHGSAHPRGMPGMFRQQIAATLRLTDRKKITEATADRISLWLATAILNNATVSAAADDDENLLLEWVTMHDKDVRHAHRLAEGQRREPGKPFRIDGHDMAAPGDPSAPIELWINCRCSLRPVFASDLAAGVEEEVSMTASDTSNLSVIVALPAEGQPVHSVGDEQKHITLAFLGEFSGDVGTVQDAVAGVGGSMEPFTADVAGTAVLGPDHAKVWLVESGAIATLRQRLLDNEAISDAVAAADTHPHFIPHVTIGYDDMPAEATDITEITFDRLAVWHGKEQTEFALGDGMTEKQPETTDTEPTTDEPVTSGLIPWHGVLAPENVRSGDGRKFAAGSLRVRPLPLPLTWQKTSADGHSGSVTVAKINRIERVDGEMRADGFMLASPEADEVVGLLAEFGRFGVSVDADDASFEMDEENEEVVFTDARIASASIVAIPAFAEAWVSLGDAPADFFGEDAVVADDPGVEPVPDEEALVASIGHLFKDLAPGKTEDGPGWLTHPVDTDRLRDYWVRGPGAAKIGWGTPGDFNRCRVNVAEYVKPQYLNGYCANRHYDALGFWPGRPVAGETVPFAYEKMELTHTDPAEAINLVSSGGSCAPSEWFTDPEFAEGDGRMVFDKETGTWGCPLTITEEGQVYGHIAKWKTCHTSWANTCITAPHSTTGYAHFLLGAVLTDKGLVPCGNLTIGGGHAGPRLSARAAIEHYDSTSAAFADVTVGEDEFGIWCAGWIRPGTSDEMIHAARASKLSGDWRKVGSGLEMVAALAVNVPGFQIPRIAAGVERSEQMSLVAAGVVSEVSVPESKVDMDALADAVAARIMEAQARKEKMAALAARFERSN